MGCAVSLSCEALWMWSLEQEVTPHNTTRMLWTHDPGPTPCSRLLLASLKCFTQRQSPKSIPYSTSEASLYCWWRVHKLVVDSMLSASKSYHSYFSPLPPSLAGAHCKLLAVAPGCLQTSVPRTSPPCCSDDEWSTSQCG